MKYLSTLFLTLFSTLSYAQDFNFELPKEEKPILITNQQIMNYIGANYCDNALSIITIKDAPEELASEKAVYEDICTNNQYVATSSKSGVDHYQIDFIRILDSWRHIYKYTPMSVSFLSFNTVNMALQDITVFKPKLSPLDPESDMYFHYIKNENMDLYDFWKLSTELRKKALQRNRELRD